MNALPTRSEPTRQRPSAVPRTQLPTRQENIPTETGIKPPKGINVATPERNPADPQPLRPKIALADSAETNAPTESKSLPHIRKRPAAQGQNAPRA